MVVAQVGDVVLPGDVYNVNNKKKITVGPGLKFENERLIITKPGLLREKSPNIHWVDCHQKRVSI